MIENKIYLNLGCGIKKINGCINIDCREECNPDLVYDIRNLPYKSNFIDGIYAIDVLEHLSRDQVIPTLKSWYNILKKKGYILLRLPNLKNIAMRYHYREIDTNEFSRLIYGRQEDGEPENYHKSGFDKKTLTKIMKKIGFKEIKGEFEGLIPIGCNENNMLLKFRK